MSRILGFKEKFEVLQADPLAPCNPFFVTELLKCDHHIGDRAVPEQQGIDCGGQQHQIRDRIFHNVLNKRSFFHFFMQSSPALIFEFSISTIIVYKQSEKVNSFLI